MTSNPKKSLSYTSVGVDTDAASVGLSGLLYWVKQTLEYRRGVGEPLVPIGFFASVVRLADDLSLAISTDGVGSKSVVAQLVGQFDGIGEDCVAVNVNDVICTGAEPLGMLDYISLEAPHPELLEQLGRGLQRGALQSQIAIVGGELSQHPDTLAGPRPGYAFDIAGTAFGLLRKQEPITGASVRPGDVILGLGSNGIHCNGLTLARHVLLGEESQGISEYVDELGCTIGEELLRPTRIYSKEVMMLLQEGIDIRGLAHISGDGLLNLTRLDSPVSYAITDLPEIPPIFELIRQKGDVGLAEMYRVFNMGIGFCMVLKESQAKEALAILKSQNGDVQVIGKVVDDNTRTVFLPEYQIAGRDGHFTVLPK